MRNMLKFIHLLQFYCGNVCKSMKNRGLFMNKCVKRKTMLILSLLMIFLVMGAVSAADDNIASDGFLTQDYCVEESQLSSGGSVVLSDTSAGTLTELNGLIENANENDTITLDKDYNNTYPQDIINKYGLTIDKQLTINGNGHTIDGNGIINIFQVTADNVVLNNITFINVKSDKSGGAVIWSGNNGVLNNSVFQDNTAVDGGAVYWSGSNGMIMNSVFRNNNATKCGGAVCIGGTDVAVINSIFTNNYASAGSAIYWMGKNGIITQSTFDNNVAVGTDSVFESSKGNIIVNTDNSFTNNTISNDFASLFLNLEDGSVVNLDKDWVNNGRIYINTNNLTINGNGHIIDGNSTGVFWILGENVTIRDITIQNAYDSSASAIVWRGVNGLLENSNFINNTATGSEGGAINWRTVDGTIINSTFINNRLTGTYGGAVFMLDGTQFIYNSTFINNTAGTYGGALLKGAGVVDGCEFYDNIGGYEGGAIIVHDNNVTISNSVFYNNTATRGGALFVLVSGCEIYDCNFTNNFVSDSGGAIWFRSDGYDNNVDDCNFINNTAKIGGAIDIQGTSVIISDSNFTNNSATSTGGAISSRSEGSSIIGCNFTGNVATASSGAVHSTYNICIDDDIFTEDSDLVNITNASLLYNGDIYISPDGNGQGRSIDDCANWSYALENIASGNTIYLTGGRYTDIVNQTISKSLNIVGLSNDVVIDLENKGRAFLIPTGNSTVANITFINGYYFEDEGGVIRWTGKYGRLLNSTFINNTGIVGAVHLGGYYAIVDNCNFTNNTGNGYGAIYVTSSRVYLCNSTFINNTGSDFNDMNYRGGLVLTNNTFYGSYIAVADNLVEGYNYVFLRVTPDNEDLIAQMTIDGEFKNNYTIIANSTGNDCYYISGLTQGQEYDIDFIFVPAGSNKYYNLESKSFKYLGDYTLYVSPDGTGNGSEDNPTNWSNAISIAPIGATIYLLNGNYTDIVLQDVISMNDIKIIGLGDCIIENSNIGELSVFGDNVFISNITFKSTAVSLDGNNIRMDNVKFIDCVDNMTHAIYWTGSNGVLSNAEFTNCVSNVSGSAVYWSGAYGLLTDCNFTNCAVDNNTINAGAIYWYGANGKIRNSKFENCTGANYGGAIFWYGANGILSNSTFTGCNARYGGAIWWNGARGRLYECEFNNCTAVTDAGAIDWRSTEGMIYNSRFINCSAVNDGAFDAIGSYNVVYNCTFIDCNSSSNGGAYRAISGSNNLLLACDFINCHSNAHSGAIYATRAMNIEYCTFINCSANTHGGAMTAQNSGIVISNSSFINCTAKSNGGAIWWHSEGGKVLDCNFTDNTATGNSNDIYLEYNVTLKNNTFTGDYIDIPDYILIHNMNDGAIKSTASNENTFVTVKLNDTGFEVNILANNTGDIPLVYKNIINATGNYTVTASFSDDTNTYNSRSKVVTVLDEAAVIYVEPYGTGDGSFENPANWNHALNDIATYNSTIILLEGVYYDILSSTIDTYVKINTSGDVVIDAQGEHVFTITADNILLSNITFINSYTASTGGTISWSGANGTLINATFINCTTNRGNGGALDCTGANMTIDNSRFINCTSFNNSAGAIAFRSNAANAVVSNSIFDNCEALYYGGAIRFWDNAVNGTIIYSNFTNCNITREGGGAVYTYSRGLKIQDCNFVNCTNDANNGGALRLYANECKVINSNFTNCVSAGTNGGGAIFLQGSYMLVDNCNFLNCSSPCGGGIRIWNNQYINITNCNFTDCYSNYTDGGAIAAIATNYVKIDNCDFVNCSAPKQGGAVRIAGYSNVTNCNFTDCNVSGNDGGAIRVAGGSYNRIAYCNFNNCSANAYAGAVRLTSNNNEVAFCNFTNCYTPNGAGGAICAEYTNISVYNSTFNNCHASTNGGGAISIGTNCSVQYCNFTDCYTTVNDGGALRISGRNTVVSDSNFINCSAKAYGGAIRINSGAHNATIANCNFYNISANTQGIAIFLESSNSSVINSNFKNINAPGGGTIRISTGNSNATIYNCTFFNITGGEGSVFSIYRANDINISNNVLENCNSSSTIIRCLDGNTTLEYNAFINSGKINRECLNIIYNWYGNNTPNLIAIQNINTTYLEARWDKVYESLICGEWNGVLDVYFVKNNTDERVDVAWDRPVEYTVTSDNAEVKDLFTSTYGKLYVTDADAIVKVEGKVDNQNLSELVFGATDKLGFNELQNIIKGTKANETLVLNNNYTYSPDDDGELINGIVIDKPITIDFEGSQISGNNVAKSIFNIISDDVTLENMTLSDVDGTAIVSTGNNTKINNLNAVNIKDTVIDIIADNAVICNVNVTGESGTAVSIKGNNPVVKNITSDNYDNDFILIDGESDEGTLNVTIGDVTYPEKALAVISASVDGIYILTTNDKDYVVNVTDGFGTAEIDLLNAGVYEAVVKSNLTTFNVTGTTEFTVHNITIEYMNVNVDNVAYPDEAVVIVNADVDGLYIVTVNNKTYNVNVINGTGSAKLDVLFTGNYTVDAVSNISNYDIISNTTEFTVKGMDTNFTLDDYEVVENTVTEIPVDLPSDATANVSISVNGEVVDTAELVNGSAVLKLPEFVAGKKYNIIVEYPGDERYEGFSQNFVTTVKTDEDLNITIPEVYENKTTEIPIVLPSDATGNVSLLVDGEVVDTKELVNGSAVLEISDLSKGDHNITVSYSGDSKYASQSEEFNISVLDDTFIYADDLIKYYSAPDKFIFIVTDSEGNPLINKTAKITINNVTYTRTTNENGSASFNIRLLPGVYEITVNVDNVTISRNVTVLSTINGTDIVKIFRNGTQYYVTIKDANGNYLPEGSMVEFNINGVFYNRTVKGDEGLVKLNINLSEGEYIVSATNLETNETISNTITVIKSIVSEDLTKYYRNGTQYCVTLLDDNGNPVGEGVNVTFNINGVFYTRHTNASGVAKLNINLLEGNYIITANYNGCLVSNNIEVLPVLLAEDLIKQEGMSDPFVITLLNGQGQPYENQEVTFNINGVIYKATTDNGGQAKLNINLPYGKYIITSSYNGCSISNTIMVTY